MAHLTPHAFHFTSTIPGNLEHLTRGCSDFFTSRPPPQWLAEEYMAVDTTFDTFLDTLEHLGKAKTCIATFCYKLHQYYRSTHGQSQLRLLKENGLKKLSKEMAKSSTHRTVYDEIHNDNDNQDPLASTSLATPVTPSEISAADGAERDAVPSESTALKSRGKGKDTKPGAAAEIDTAPSESTSLGGRGKSKSTKPEAAAKADTTGSGSSTQPKSSRVAITKPVTEKSRRSFGERFQGLGQKWVLSSGTVVENVIFNWGNADQDTYSPLHSFMVDLNDPDHKKLFTDEDWSEIISDLPSQALYSKETQKYMEIFEDVKTLPDLSEALRQRPMDTESRIVHCCLQNWHDMYSMTPSPFSAIDSFGEAWWMQSAWGACAKLANGVDHSFILPGEKSNIDTANRINTASQPSERKRVGAKADLLWRTLIAPAKDWGAAEAAGEWDAIGQKYRYESTHKLPRQLHDMLAGRTHELGNTDLLRQEFVTGLIIGGPVVQRLMLCWGTKGENVTRLLRIEERRIMPSIDLLAESLWGIHELLLFRV
ncbi:hypothetical protein BGX31_001080 [Mortierella sp. GBA43]|nr:hypothetical protein BGX31_001080 [Mortierella sp. GBA43]